VPLPPQIEVPSTTVHRPHPSRPSNRPPRTGGWGGRRARASSSPLPASTRIGRERRKMPLEIHRVAGRRPPRAAASHAVFLDFFAAHHLLYGRSRIRPPQAPALPRRGQARSPVAPSCTRRIVRRGGRCHRLPQVVSSGPPARAGVAGFGAARRSRGGGLWRRTGGVLAAFCFCLALLETTNFAPVMQPLCAVQRKCIRILPIVVGVSLKGKKVQSNPIRR
jgi:hypothetical protein